MNSLSISVGLIAFIFTNQILAAEIPSLIRLTSDIENASLNADCYGDSKAITCFFSRVEISKVEAILEKPFSHDMLEEDRDAITKQTAEICAKSSELKSRVSRELTDEKRSALADGLRMLETLCSCKNERCKIDAYNNVAQSRSNTCKISNRTFTVSFKKTGDNKWFGTEKGSCYSVNTTLERTGKRSFDWKYTNQRVPLAGKKTAECKELEKNGFDFSKSITYSNPGSESLKIDCDFIEFGT